MSFDPWPVSLVRTMAPGIFRGIVAERRYTHAEWNFLTPAQKRNLIWMLHAPVSRPSVHRLSRQRPAGGGTHRSRARLACRC